MERSRAKELEGRYCGNGTYMMRNILELAGEEIDNLVVTISFQ